MFGIHPADLAIIVAYLVLVITLGHLASRKGSRSQEDYFLAGRKLGKLYQFFLNFGNATDANGAVSATSAVYQQGVSGVWLGFQMIFLNPYYWFMNTWFRRVRLVTMADLFVDRLGCRKLASFYALFQSLSAIFVVIGFGNLVTYKISAALIVKPEAAWTSSERQSIEGFRELGSLKAESKLRTLAPAETERMKELVQRDQNGELKAFITALDPTWFYIAYTLVVGIYVIAGGMAATAVNEVVQSLIIVAFSIVLIPTGLAAIGGASALNDNVPQAMFELVGSNPALQQITGFSLFALFLVAIIQINGIIGNMGISGSAKDEYSARFGAVAGTYGKRLMFILWSFAGLIALALYHGPQALSDPDLAWGTMSRQLLGPGLLGLMITGVLAANMSTVSSQTVSVSALLVRNVYLPLRGATSDREAVYAGRLIMFVTLALGVVAASSMDDVVSSLLIVQTVNVPMGATVLLMFFWRRLTVPAVWTGILLSVLLTILAPLVAGKLSYVATHASLTVSHVGEDGKLSPVFFENVGRQDPADPASTLIGRGRLHLELVALQALGVPVPELASGTRFGLRLLVDALFPFALLLGVSLLTRPPERTLVDQFFGKMKTQVASSPQQDVLELEATRLNPSRFDHQKLFPGSSWEFARWDRTDTVGFIVCLGISGAIIGLFWFLLWLTKNA